MPYASTWPLSVVGNNFHHCFLQKTCQSRCGEKRQPRGYATSALTTASDVRESRQFSNRLHCCVFFFAVAVVLLLLPLSMAYLYGRLNKVGRERDFDRQPRTAGDEAWAKDDGDGSGWLRDFVGVITLLKRGCDCMAFVTSVAEIGKLAVLKRTTPRPRAVRSSRFMTWRSSGGHLFIFDLLPCFICLIVCFFFDRSHKMHFCIYIPLIYAPAQRPSSCAPRKDSPLSVFISRIADSW